MKKIFFNLILALTNVSFHADNKQESENVKCQYCGKPGKVRTSPWGIPATVCVCKFHLWTLIFSPRITSIGFFLILLVVGVIWLIFF